MNSRSPALGVRSGGARPLDVALTIDDGPSPHTQALLDVLAEHGAVATFFLVTSHIEHSRGAALLRRMLAEGHQVAQHSASHVGADVSAAEYERELLSANACLLSLGVQPPIQHRLPFGLLPRDVGGGRLAALEATAIDSLGWSVDSEDWKLSGTQLTDPAAPARIVQNVLRGLGQHSRAPAIVLLHELAPSVQALTKLVPELIDRGYHFVRADQLAARSAFAPHVRCGYYARNRPKGGEPSHDLRRSACRSG